MSLKKIALLGSTGSIGRQTLEVADAFPDKLQVIALAAGNNVKLLIEQIEKYKPSWVSVKDEQIAGKLRSSIDYPCNLLSGDQGLSEIASLAEVDCVVVALSGIAGLAPTIKALENQKCVALANKETLVCAGQIVKKYQKKVNQLLPIDSEHSAVFQCMEQKGTVEKIILTASGGPFRLASPQEVYDATPQTALKHPNWNMGRKISIDSATMMNKGLEVIEARWLFDLDYSAIDVVVHPQSIIHSLVAYQDGSQFAHLGLPDMRIPIQYALSWPERWVNELPRLNLAKIGNLTFEEVDNLKFPALNIAYEAGKSGGVKPAALNAANEQAVDLFLAEKIKFGDIILLVERVVAQCDHIAQPSLEDILETDRWARAKVLEMIS